LIKTAIRDPNPVVFVESISLYSTKSQVADEEYLIPLGQAEVKRPGEDVTVVALGPMVPKALKAAEQLADEGLELEVIDPRSIMPLDINTIVTSVEKTGRLVVTHLAHKTGGVGAEIAQQVTERAFDALDGPVVRVAAADVPIAASARLEKATFPDVADIVQACKSFRRTAISAR
jgi:pyruvate/2-oxoglutarate/acetoin dehydrogenase E1 component